MTTNYEISERLARSIQRPTVTDVRPLSADEFAWMATWDDDFSDENGAYVMASGEVVTWTKFKDEPMALAYPANRLCSISVTIFNTDGSVTEYGDYDAPVTN